MRFLFHCVVQIVLAVLVLVLVCAAIVGTMAAFEGHAMGVAVTVAVLGGALYVVVKTSTSALRKWGQRREAVFAAALETHFGRRPDFQWSGWFDDGKRREWRFCIWTPERRIYFADRRTGVDPKGFHDAFDIREWRVEREPGGLHTLVYSVNILVKDPANPLIKLRCGREEAEAYKIAESINQMFGGDAIAIRDGYAIAAASVRPAMADR